MMNGKVRMIFSNENVWGDYREAAEDIFCENGIEIDSLSQKETVLFNIAEELAADAWRVEKEQLENFFKGSTWILQGTLGLWSGTHPAGYVFTDFSEMLSRAMKDCDYFSIFDINGHLYLRCQHHDGTNNFEIKKLTEKGIRYYENQNSDEKMVHDRLFQAYSVLPHYTYLVYGCPKRELAA